MPQVSLNTPLDDMAISAIVELYNEFAEKPVKGFRDKPTAIARLQKLGIDIVEPGSKIEATTDSPGMRRMAQRLSPTDQEALRQGVLADQAAATTAVAAPTAPDAPPATPIAAGFATRPVAPRKASRAPSTGKGKGKGHSLFEQDAVINIVDGDLQGKRGDGIARFAEYMRDGMTVGEYLALPGTKRRDVRVAWRKHGMITLNGEKWVGKPADVEADE